MCQSAFWNGPKSAQIRHTIDTWQVMIYSCRSESSNTDAQCLCCNYMVAYMIPISATPLPAWCESFEDELISSRGRRRWCRRGRRGHSTSSYLLFSKALALITPLGWEAKRCAASAPIWTCKACTPFISILSTRPTGRALIWRVPSGSRDGAMAGLRIWMLQREVFSTKVQFGMEKECLAFHEYAHICPFASHRKWCFI